MTQRSRRRLHPRCPPAFARPALLAVVGAALGLAACISPAPEADSAGSGAVAAGPAEAAAELGPTHDVHFGFYCVPVEGEESRELLVRVAGEERVRLPLACSRERLPGETPPLEIVTLTLPERTMEIAFEDTHRGLEHSAEHSLTVSGETWLQVNHRVLGREGAATTVQTSFSPPWPSAEGAPPPADEAGAP